MKKSFSLLIAFAFATTVSLSFQSSVNADTSNGCGNATISNTGPGSENTVTCEEDRTVVINCSNGTVIRIDVDQDAESGDAENENNTNSGGATSGDADNDSDLVIDVDNSCADAEEEPTEPTPVVPNTTTPNQPTPAQPEVKVASVLPETGEMSVAQIAGLSAAAVLALALIGKSGLAVYRRLS